MKQLFIGLLACFGGLLIHILIGSLYQWGIINIYITSYFKIQEPSLSLQSNQIIFPVMMFCIGLTMKIGLSLSSKYGAFYILLIMTVSSSLVVFVSSYMTSFPVFVVLYSVLFGLIVGMGYMIPLRQGNLYFQNKKKIYVNGFILIGTGLGPAIFGEFSYNYLNPSKLAPHNGYYDGDLRYIAQKVPTCIRYLALMYLLIGILGTLLMYPAIKSNQAKTINKPDLPVQSISATNQNKVNYPTQINALKSFIFYAIAIVALLSTCGTLLVNGNYKTYVKSNISDDQYLTFIGLIGSFGNGFTRFFWSLLYQLIGFRKVYITAMVLEIVIFVTIRYTIAIKQIFCFMIFLANSSLACILVNTPTLTLNKFGQPTGGNLYGIYWCCFATANFIQYALVVYLSKTFGFNNIFYICAGMAAIVTIFLILYDFQVVWQNQATQEFKQDKSNQRIKNIQNFDKNAVTPDTVKRFDQNL